MNSISQRIELAYSGQIVGSQLPSDAGVAREHDRIRVVWLVKQAKTMADLMKRDCLDVELGPDVPRVLCVVVMNGEREPVNDNPESRWEVSVSEYSSDHAQVWVICWPPLN
jgi:hypothetical protein